MDMKERLQELAEAARKRIEESDGPDKLNEVKVAYLGKKGELTAILKSMKDVAPEDRPKVGQMVNETRAKIEEHLEATRKKLEEALREEKMKSEVIDVTLPAKKAKIGHRHPNSIALEEEMCIRDRYIDGVAQFSPIADGRISEVVPSDETKEAVKQALEGVDYSDGALFFIQRSAAAKNNIQWFDKNLKKLFKHGVHEFYTYPEAAQQ